MSKETNPEQQKIHIVTFNFPAQKMPEQIKCSLVTTESARSHSDGLCNINSLPKVFDPPQLGRGIEYHLIKITMQDCIVSGGNLPRLLNKDIQEQVQAALSYTLSKQRPDAMQLMVLIEGDMSCWHSLKQTTSMLQCKLSRNAIC